MLMEQALEIKSKIEAIVNLRIEREHTNTFKTRAAQLGIPREKLTLLIQALRALRTQNISPDFPIDKLQAIKSQLEELASQYRENPHSIIEPSGDRRFSLWDQLRELPEEIRICVGTAWEDYVDNRLPPKREELMRVLDQVPGFTQQIVAINDLYAQAQPLKPLTRDLDVSIGRLEDIRSSLLTACSSLESDQIPDEVLEFLRAASSDGASLHHLTEDVVGWLRKNELGDAVRIRFEDDAT